MGLITQLQTVEKGLSILTRTTNASQQFANSANSLLAELAAFEATLAGSGLDTATLAEVATLKATAVAAVQTQLTAIQTALGDL